MRARRREGGFTLMEIMVSMLVLVLGLLGVIALQMTTVKGNRISRQLDRAVDLVEQEMEDLRGMSTDTIAALPATYFPDITSSDGVVYKRSFTATKVAGQATLYLVTATVTYPDDADSTIMHTQTMQMLRTSREGL